MTDDVNDAQPSLEEQAQELKAIPMSKLAKVYRRMQARIQELTREYETQVEEIQRQQDAVKFALKEQMLTAGSTSVRTENGTVVLAVKTRYSTQDWDSFKEFVRDNDVLDLFEKRIAQTNMREFLENNPDLVPPGLNSYNEYTISVRKPS